MKKIYLCLVFSIMTLLSHTYAQTAEWVFLPEGTNTGTCTSTSNYQNRIICYGLEYTPGTTGTMTSYTFGFLADCNALPYPNPIMSSCTLGDNSVDFDGCVDIGQLFIQPSGNTGNVPITAGTPIILHQVCLNYDPNVSYTFVLDNITSSSVSIDPPGGGAPVTDEPTVADFPVDYAGFGIVPCEDTVTCSVSFGSTEERVSFQNNANGTIVDGSSLANSQSNTQSFDVYDEEFEICQFPGGMNDIDVTVEILNTSDLYGNGIIDAFAGTSHQIIQETGGLNAQIPFATSNESETSTSDIRGYDIRVDFADHLQIVAGKLSVDLSSVNSIGVGFESAAITFYDFDGNAFSTATYTGYYDAVADLSGSCNPTGIAGSAWSVSGSGNGVVLINNSSTVDLADPCSPSAGFTTTDTISVHARFDAGLDSLTFITGFSLRVIGEDVAAPPIRDDGSGSNGDDGIIGNAATNTNTTLISSLLGYTIDGCVFENPALPVEFVGLDAWVDNEESHLQWATANEINHSHFVVEWSTNGFAFNKIGVVDHSNSEGHINRYKFTHPDPFKGLNYYRIKQVDLDEKFEYSAIKKLFINEGRNGDIDIFPNPVHNVLNINLSDLTNKPLQIELYSVAGIKVMQEAIYTDNTFYTLNLENLETGIYLININGEVSRIIKL